MNGKCMTHLIRLSGLINSLNKAAILIRNAPDVSTQYLTDEFVEYCKINLIEKNEYLADFSKINVEAVKYAEDLLK